MSIKGWLVDNMYGGVPNYLDNTIIQCDDATSPDGVVSATKGTHLVVQYDGDNSDGDVYINTDGATAWTQIRNPV